MALEVKFLWALLLTGAGATNACIKEKSSYYDDSVPPSAVGYMDTAAECQAACAVNAGCDAWTFLKDASTCWQLPYSPEMVLVGNDKGTSGDKHCEPVGTTGLKKTWTTPLPNMKVPEPVTGRLGLRPNCSSSGAAFHDPAVKMATSSLASAVDCQASCAALPSCHYWTYYNNSRACWLQGFNVTTFEEKDAVSGPKACQKILKASRYEAGQNITNNGQAVMMRSIPRPACSFRGKAYVDTKEKVPNLYLADATACQAACGGLSSCNGFTYYIDTKACWLVDETATAYESAMAVSGPKACAVPVILANTSKVQAVPVTLPAKLDTDQVVQAVPVTLPAELDTSKVQAVPVTLPAKLDTDQVVQAVPVTLPAELDTSKAVALEEKTEMIQWQRPADFTPLLLVAAAFLALAVAYVGRAWQVRSRAHRPIASVDPELTDDLDEELLTA
ncbi:unnamed protein product [Effrenium voratum]|uniref:Apple domain-containing protein n=1 Tax=Effrenium voratum TaxID=2562239 RepID=A0AA36MXM4_9DINO|nr:unnamed protein product [Effrenium voratum]